MAGPLFIECETPRLKCPCDGKLYVRRVNLKKGSQTLEIQEVKNSLMINQLESEGNEHGRQNVWEKLLMVKFSSYTACEIIETLTKTIQYDDSRYCFLGFSDVQLKDKTCFLIAETDKQISERRKKFGNFGLPCPDQITSIKDLFEPLKRSLQLKKEKTEFKNNAENTEMSGFISPELAKQISSKSPSVVQVICPGFSGKLVLDHEIRSKVLLTEEMKEEIEVLFNTSESMNNYGDPVTIGIIDYSKPYEMGYLNLYTVMFLRERGVASDYLKELQRFYYEMLEKLGTGSETHAKYFLRLIGRKDIFEMTEDGLTPVVKETIGQMKSNEINKMKEVDDSLKILVSQSREVFGIVDPYKNQKNKLKSNQCVFAPDLDSLNLQDKELFEFVEKVLVIPEPCYSASDIQELEVVRDSHGQYTHLKDCIVLPSQTKAQAVPGKYFVTWDSNLLKQSTPSSSRNFSIPNLLSLLGCGRPSEELTDTGTVTEIDKADTLEASTDGASVTETDKADTPEASTDTASVIETDKAETPEARTAITTDTSVPSTTRDRHKEDISFQKELIRYFAEFKSSDDLILSVKEHFKNFSFLKESPSCPECETLGKYLSQSTDWNAQRDDIEKYLRKLDREYKKKKQSSKAQESEGSADRFCTSDLQALCDEMTNHLNEFLAP
ncbi:uncharacterized protein LOC111332044 [Stylophora pistillata]|nr:uncharacterized protein LOC111332044 [Stylophora pistillata]